MLTLVPHFVAQIHVPCPKGLHSLFMHAHFLQTFHHSYCRLISHPTFFTLQLQNPINVPCKNYLMFPLVHNLLSFFLLILIYLS